MSIQTSRIQTESDDNLTISPAGQGEVILEKQKGAGEVIISASNEGVVKKADFAQFPSNTSSLDDTDLFVIQRAGGTLRVPASEVGGTKVAIPLPGDITADPPFAGGAGSITDPFICTPSVVTVPGGSTTSVQEISVFNQPISSVISFEVLEGTQRFAAPSTIANEIGASTFRLPYLDAPASADGQKYSGLIKMGEVYFRWDVTQVISNTVYGPLSAPTASPSNVNYPLDGKFGQVSGTWNDGSRSIFATGSAVFSVNNGTLSNLAKSIQTGDTITLAFDDAAVAAAIPGEVIQGAIETSDGSYSYSYSMTKDVTPGAFSISPLNDAPASTEVTSGNISLRGFNAPALVNVPVGSGSTFTGVEYEIGGVTYTTVDINAGGVYINPGENFKIKGTTGSADSTTYSLVVNIGGVSATWSVTTTAAPAAFVAQPYILTPTNFGSDLQAQDVSIVSSSYSGSGNHASSSWEAYSVKENAVLANLSSSVISDSPGASGGPTQTLTLEDSTNLSLFTQGTQVQQSGSYSARSDDISNVSIESFSFSDNTYGSAIPNDVNKRSDADKVYQQASGEAIINLGDSNGFSYFFTLLPEAWSRLGWFTDDETQIRFEVGGSDNCYFGWVLLDDNGQYDFTNFIVSSDSTQVTLQVGNKANRIVGWYVQHISGTTGKRLYSVSTVNSNNSGGRKLIDGQFNYGNVELTFYSSDDLKYFVPGDVVGKKVDPSWDTRDMWSGSLPVAVNNDHMFTNGPGGTTPTDGASLTLNFNNLEPLSGTVRYSQGRPNDSRVKLGLSINGTDYSNHIDQGWSSSVRTVMDAPGGTTPLYFNDINQITFSVGNYGDTNHKPTIGFLEIGGKRLIDTGTPGTVDVQVVSVDESGPKMVVDGGEWALNLNVEGPSKTAGGSVVSVNEVSNQITLSNVTDPWVDNNNNRNLEFTIIDPTSDGVPVAPNTNPPSPDAYEYVDSLVDSTTSKITWDNHALFGIGKTIFTRVKHKNDEASPVESSWSDWSGFQTQSIPQPGQLFEGGYFAGQVKTGNSIYNIIVSPKEDKNDPNIRGEFEFNAANPSFGAGGYQLRWKTENTPEPNNSPFTSLTYGRPAQQSADGAQFSGCAFQWARGNAPGTPNHNGGLGGFTDWYIPALYEMEVVYYSFKPTVSSNSTSDDTINPIAYPSRQRYTADNPGQTTNSLFREGGAEAFGATRYWTASEYAGEKTNAWLWNFASGPFSGAGVNKGGEARTRVIRRVAA